MCGITGFFQFTNHPAPAELIKRMNATLIHRGPDSDGFFEDHQMHLAMRRLKVIDLETGNQPISNDDKSLWIIFNGEIYNYQGLRNNLIKKGHRFKTHSDTEVILRQYQEEGENCVHSLIGMFAFAIYDVKKDSLFIARDRLGVKPLFYHYSQTGFVFGSEIKALLEVPWIKKEINPQAISHFLSLNYLPSPWTPWKDIYHLEPGHWLKISKTALEKKQYWDIPTGQTIDVSEEEALKEITRLLHQSMERRLIADVPVGAFLSGGLDSSTLVWLMKEHRHDKIKTFSVGFDHPDYDETPYAREVAKYFGTDHYEIRCTSDDVMKTLPKIAWHADNLLADQACLPLYLVSKLAKEHVTVCLSGDGGDEVFVGYPTLHADRYHQIYSRIPKFLRSSVIEPLIQAIPASSSKVSAEYKAKKFIQAGDFSNAKAHYWWRTIYSDNEKATLLSDKFRKSISSLDSYPLYERFYGDHCRLNSVSMSLYADMKVWLEGNNLYKVDTMTMAHGLEARVPFLDHELVEYVAKLPPALRFKNNTLKYLLKKIIQGKLPTTILQRKKAGFHSPLPGWFQNQLPLKIKEALIQGNNNRWSPGLKPQEVSKLLDEHVSGRHNHSFKIWGLLILNHWSAEPANIKH